MTLRPPKGLWCFMLDCGSFEAPTSRLDPHPRGRPHAAPGGVAQHLGGLEVPTILEGDSKIRFRV